MAKKGSSKKAPAVPNDDAGAEALPDAVLAEKPKVKKRAHNLTDTEDIPAKKTKTTTKPPLRSMPKCNGQNEDPVGRHAKAAKAAEAKAAKAAKATEKTKKAIEAEVAKEKLAQSDMEIVISDGDDGDESDGGDNSDAEEAAEEPEIKKTNSKGKKRVVKGKYTLSQQQDKGANATSEFESDGTDSDLEMKTRTKKKRTVQPKLRDEVAGKKNKIKDKRIGGNDANIASGLNTAWHEAQKSKKKRVTIATEKMDNAAAMSMRPNFPPSPRFDRQAANDQLAKVKPDKRNPSRKNTLVAPVSEHSDSDSVLSLAVICRPTKPRLPSNSKGKKVTKSVNQSKARQDKKNSTRDSDADSFPDCGHIAIMPKGGNNSNLLPSVLSSLKSKYLSTLFNALYASEEPFDHFTKTSPMFLKTSHQAFESVWPHLKIQVETDDIMYNIGYQRVIEKHGRIHDAVKEAIEQHFIVEGYLASEIREWVQWFCSTHGSPVFYETPIPQDGIWDPKDPNYTKPHGFLKNSFLICIGSRFLVDSQESAFNYGPPKGLFVLILTAYEKIIQTGIYVSSSDFAAKYCNRWIRQYYKNFATKMAEWWMAILEFYVMAPETEPEKAGDMSILDEGRAALPMSSP